MDVSISIVSYNTKDLLKRCIDSIKKYTQDISYEIIVVDNGSTDGTRNMLRGLKVKTILNNTNLFFSKANNQAFKKAQGRYFLILNSDTYFVDNPVKQLVDYLDTHADVGIAEGLELYEDGTIVETGSRNSSPIIDFYELSIFGKRIADKKKIKDFRFAHISRKRTFEINVACYAFLMIRSELFKKLKGYDEDLSLYYTENDLCIRSQKMGYKIMHYGECKVMHIVSVSANKLRWKKLDIYYKDMLVYYKKHGKLAVGLFLFIMLHIEKLLLRVFRPNMFA